MSSSKNNCSSSPDAKKPCKGILKSSSSFDKQGTSSGGSNRKSAKFDELNVLQTYHPADKDYGHMKIDEPKTPYNYSDSDITVDQLDANVLTERLKEAAKTRTSVNHFSDDSVDGEDDNEDLLLNETESEREKRLEFEKKRKAHYNEFEAIRLARKLIEEEDEEDDDDDEGNQSKSSDK